MSQDHSLHSMPFKVHNYDFRLYPSISILLRQIGLYLSIECFNSQLVFCATFLLKVHGFILFLAPLFVAQNPKYRDFKVPKPFLQFRNVLLRYRHIKCIYTNYIGHKRYLGHQIGNLCGALLLFLVHGSWVAPILISLCYH